MDRVILPNTQKVYPLLRETFMCITNILAFVKKKKLFCFVTVFLCVVLAVLELTLETRLTQADLEFTAWQ